MGPREQKHLFSKRNYSGAPVEKGIKKVNTKKKKEKKKVTLRFFGGEKRYQ